MTTVRTYLVPGISCDHCKNAIEGALGGVPDVRRVEVNVGAKTVAVEGDATEPLVRAAIEEAGYEVAGTVS